MTGQQAATISKKDSEFRNFALNGNIWHVVLYVGLPLALYQTLTLLFKIVDSMMAAHISSNAVSAVSYLSQINLMLSAIGSGLAVGSSLKISESYGAGDYDQVKTQISSMFALCGLLGISVLVLLFHLRHRSYVF